MTVDHDALREKYRLERDKRLRPDGNDQYLEPTGKFAHMRRRPLRRAGRARAGLRRGDGRAHRRRLRRAVHRRAPEAGRHRRRPHHRGRRRRRRRLVLEPLSRARCATPRRWSTCRCSRRPGTCRRRSTSSRPRSSRTASASPRTFGLYDNALFSTAVTALEWDDGDGALDHPHRPRRRDPRPVRRHGHRAAAPAEAAGHPRHRDVRRSLLPHQPLGLRLHRRRLRPARR